MVAPGPVRPGLRSRLALALSLLLVLPAPACRPRGPAPPSVAGDTRLVLPALAAPARIVTDRFGIPHLSAASLSDLYFAWGFVTARDRLWQLEHTRRAASGTLWEWFGNRALTGDGGAQLFRLRERAEAIWAREREDPAVRDPLERYTAGINAWIALCREGRAPWPVEFQRLDRQPADWRPENAYLVLLAQGLLLDLDLPEIAEAREMRERGRAWVEARSRFERDITIPSIPDSVAERLYGAPQRRAAIPGGRDGAAVPPRLLAEARRTLSGWLPEPRRDPDQRASNVFALGPGLSASGAPLLANDPHLALAAPSPLHAVHLHVPGVLDAAGVSVPGLPLIVSGRSPHCAWGLTALGADVVDAYADTLSSDGRRVRWQGGWAPIVEAPFSLRYRVLGLFPIPPPGRTRRYGPHGPIVAYDRKLGLAIGVRWAGDDDAITLARLVGMERATSAAELAAAVRTLVTPTHNIVVADRDGRVVYQTAGAVPRRGFDPPPGLLPGDGAHEWQGLIEPEAMPRWELSRGDFVVNGNNLPVGPAYPEPFPRYDFMQDRAARMVERLAAAHRVTLVDLRDIQNDVRSRGAGRFLPLLLRAADSLAADHPPRVRAALDTLRAWDHAARRGSAAPTLYEAWLGALQRRSRLEGLPLLTAAALDGRAPEALRSPGSEEPERAAVAASEALELALAELERRLGPDLAGWDWGAAHRARFRHALAWKDSTLQPPPWPADGDRSTVSVGRSWLPWSVRFTHGPVWRHLVDLAVPESSVCVIPPGNAGEGPHARDHLPLWADHDYVPLYLDWSRIEAVRESEWRLMPGPAGGGNRL